MSNDKPSHGDHGPSGIKERRDLIPKIEAMKAALGLNLRRIRTDQNLTLEQAAEKTGIHGNHLQRIETGRANVTVTTLVALADTYGVTVRELFIE